MATKEKQASGEAPRQGVAERAYAIWESDGKPHGRDVDHWLRAEAELGATEKVDPPPEPQQRQGAAARGNEKTKARRK